VGPWTVWELMVAGAVARNTGRNARRKVPKPQPRKAKRNKICRENDNSREETMSRRRRVIHKMESLDSRYGSPVVARLISTVMRSGKKSVAERIVYEAIERSREGSDSVDPLDTLHKALENAKPRLEVKSRRVGGATYQVPVEVPQERQVSLAMRWIVTFAKNRRGTMVDNLAAEIKDASLGQGNAIKKRDDTHKMAQANRAFAHFRW
jgi:small subunit ribosomal protein S7